MAPGKFLKRLLLFLLPVVLLFAFAEYKVRQIPSSYDAKRKYFEKAADSTEILVLGNSHMLHGINPEYFSAKGFNLASGFQNYFFDKALTEKYLERLQHLKLVFISADYISFFYSIKDVADWMDYGYYQAWDIRYPGLSAWDSRNFSKFMLYTPTTSVNYILSGDKYGMSKNIKPDGFNPEDTTYLTMVNEEDGELRAKYHNSIINFNRQNENLYDLETLIENLKDKKIQVVLIAPPVYSTYSQNLDTSVVHRTENIINEVVAKYGCLYKDYSTDKRFDITDFHDNDHLSYRGAQKFTKTLNQDFVKPLLNIKSN